MKDELDKAQELIKDKEEQNRCLKRSNDDFQTAIIDELYALNDVIMKKKKEKTKIKEKESMQKKSEKEAVLIDLLSALQKSITSPKAGKRQLQTESEEPAMQMVSFDNSQMNSNNQIGQPEQNSEMLITENEIQYQP